jgi:subtilase family serine protease
MFFARVLLSVLIATQLLIDAALAEAAIGRIDCGRPVPGAATCFARVLPGPDGKVHALAAPGAGYSPAQFRAAYRVPAGGQGFVAVVAAYSDPQIKSDLDVYSRRFGLPVLPACTSASEHSCFARMDQRGGSQFPAANAGWAMETALDVEAVHAMCAGCRIELVEADSDSLPNLIAATDRATALGAQVVSMSWGGGEGSGETTTDTHFNHPGVIYVAASGDSGYGVSYPAASHWVLAVGGTRLVAGPTGTRSSETAWSGAGSGCSRYETKPSWQHDGSCTRRSVADVAADADPSTGAAVYTSLSTAGSGWFTVGGTSLAAPLIAGMIGAAGGGPQSAVLGRLYGSIGTARLYDVTAGSNGSCAGYLCSAGRGYDGPTGVGAPLGAAVL